MSFWGCQIKPGKKAKVENAQSDILHLSQACLHEPSDGKNYIQVEVNGTTYALACLEKGKKEHEIFDLFFEPESCTFSNKGKSEVHLLGYFEPDDGSEDDGDEEAPAPAAKKAASPKVEPAKSPKVAAAKASPKVEPAKSPKVEPAKASPKASPKAAPKAAADEESSGDEEGEEEELLEGDEEEEGEESESEEPAPPPAKKAKKAEAKAEATPAKKDAKGAASPKAAAAASPKAAPAKDISGYVKSLVDYLKQNGKTNIGVLGSKVPRPKDAPKMKAVFEQNKDKFVLAGDMVSAK